MPCSYRTPESIEKQRQTMLKQFESGERKSPAYKGMNSGEKNGQWKGDKVGYTAIHNWVRRRLIKPDCCQRCKENKPLDLANISNEYKRDLSDWEYICRKCHMNNDGRILKIVPESTLRRGVDGKHKNNQCAICGNPTVTKYCSLECFKEGRRLWWKEYNKGRKR